MKKTFCLLTAALLSVSACSVERVSNFPSYKLKVVQGNELDAQAITQLQAGLSKEQVQMLLGTPLLQDPFHRERWDYVFVTTRNGLVQENTALTLYFNTEGQLIKAEGDALQKAREQLTAQATAATQAAAASAAQ